MYVFENMYIICFVFLNILFIRLIIYMCVYISLINN